MQRRLDVRASKPLRQSVLTSASHHDDCAHVFGEKSHIGESSHSKSRERQEAYIAHIFPCTVLNIVASMPAFIDCPNNDIIK